jgi:hypothetical protein
MAAFAALSIGFFRQLHKHAHQGDCEIVLNSMSRRPCPGPARDMAALFAPLLNHHLYRLVRDQLDRNRPGRRQWPYSAACSPKEDLMIAECPVPTPAEQRYGEIQAQVEEEMFRKVHAAIEEAAKQAALEIREAGLELPPPPVDYFMAKSHQNLFCTLCKADPRTFSGGKPEIAIALIRNSQNIAKHYWGANI